jgi:hypothetical protein
MCARRDAVSDKKVVVLLIAVVGVLAGIGLLLLAVRQGSASPLAAPVAANPLSAGVVPGQFIAKIHTEAYGRLPTQAEWQALEDRFENAASCVDTVRQVVEEFYTGITFTNLYAPDVDGNRPAALLALYRGALNRELDTDSYQHYRSFPYPWATLVDDLLDNRHRQELAALTADICDLGVPSHYMVAPYYWNPDYAPLVLTPTGPIEDPWVFCGAYCGETDDDLRQLLYSATATPTRTVYLAQMAVVWITPRL